MKRRLAVLFTILLNACVSCHQEESDAIPNDDWTSFITNAQAKFKETSRLTYHAGEFHKHLRWDMVAVREETGKKMLLIPYAIGDSSINANLLAIKHDDSIDFFIRTFVRNPPLFEGNGPEGVLQVFSNTGVVLQRGLYIHDKFYPFVHDSNNLLTQSSVYGLRIMDGCGPCHNEIKTTLLDPVEIIAPPIRGSTELPPGWSRPTPNVGGHSGTNPGANPADELINKVINPCIRGQVDNVMSTDLSNELSKLMKTIYNINQDYNIEFKDSDNLVQGTVGYTRIKPFTTSTSSSISIEIFLSSTTLPKASKEYVMSTIYHEILHAVLEYNQIPPSQRHSSMAKSYIPLLADALREHFPSMSQLDAEYLSWGGLFDTDAWSKLSSVKKKNINRLNTRHSSNKTGTPCK